MPLVKGVVSSFSTNQIINRKSFTEYTLIGVYDATEKILWSRYFIEAQGYNISHNKLMQDSKRAILLEKMVNFPVQNGPSTSRLGISL